MRFGRKRLFMLSAAALLTAVLTLLSFAGCDELGLYGDAIIQEAQQLIEITDSEKSAPDTEAVTAGEAEAAQPETESPPETETPAAEAPQTTEAPKPAETTAAATLPPETEPETEPEPALDIDGSYDQKDDVALYLYLYGKLPKNYITKKEARELGWEGGSLERYAPGCCIGGDYFGNYEGLLPKKKGRTYHECDIGTLGRNSRGAKRIIYSDDGLIYYTDDHYESFTLLYGEE